MSRCLPLYAEHFPRRGYNYRSSGTIIRPPQPFRFSSQQMNAASDDPYFEMEPFPEWNKHRRTYTNAHSLIINPHCLVWEEQKVTAGANVIAYIVPTHQLWSQAYFWTCCWRTLLLRSQSGKRMFILRNWWGGREGCQVMQWEKHKLPDIHICVSLKMEPSSEGRTSQLKGLGMIFCHFLLRSP